MTILGIYLGARLTDCARLTWRSVNMEAGTISFIAKKTLSRLTIPMAEPLVEFLAEPPAPDSPDAPIFPTLSSKSASKLSEGFRSVLADAGLAEPPNKRSTGKGRHAAREVSELSFHCLRHAFVSILKSTGASQARRNGPRGTRDESNLGALYDARRRDVARGGEQTAGRDGIGAEVNAVYAHHELAPLRAAVEKHPALGIMSRYALGYR